MSVFTPKIRHFNKTTLYTFFRSNEHNGLGGKAFLVEILKEIQISAKQANLASGIMQLGQLLANDPEISCIVEQHPIESFRNIAFSSRPNEMSIKKKQQFTAFAMIAELGLGAEKPSEDLNSQFELLDTQIMTYPDRNFNYHVTSLEVIEELTCPEVGQSIGGRDVTDYRGFS